MDMITLMVCIAGRSSDIRVLTRASSLPASVIGESTLHNNPTPSQRMTDTQTKTENGDPSGVIENIIGDTCLKFQILTKRRIITQNAI